MMSTFWDFFPRVAKPRAYPDVDGRQTRAGGHRHERVTVRALGRNVRDATCQ